MKIREVLQEEKQYKKLLMKGFFSKSIVIISLFGGIMIGVALRIVCMTFHLFLLSYIPEIIGLLLIFSLLMTTSMRRAQWIYSYYYNIGDEREISFTEEAYIEKLGDDIDETPWDKLAGMQINEKGFAILTLGRPLLLLSREKLTSDDISLLENVYSKYHTCWSMDNNKNQLVQIEKNGEVNCRKEQTIDQHEIRNEAQEDRVVEEKIDRQDGRYMEMTKQRYLRQLSIRNQFYGKEGVMWLTALTGGVVYLIGLIFSPIRFIILLVIFLAIAFIYRGALLKYYNKEKLSYTFYMDLSKGLEIKRFYDVLMIQWNQVKKIQETNKDFLIYYSDIENIILPKELLTIDEQLFLHNKCH